MKPWPDSIQPGKLVRTLLLALTTVTAAFGSTPPTFRLPDSAKPLAYALELTIIPEKETFEGVVTIDTQVNRLSQRP